MTNNLAVLRTLEDRATVVRRVDAKSFMEGPEHCQEYLAGNDTPLFGA